MKRIFFSSSFSLLLCFLALQDSFAAHVDTVLTFSPSMNKNIKAVVLTPDDYKAGKSNYPVLYVLHGYGGNFSNYLKNIPELEGYADQYKMIMVFPDGQIGSWYFDSPVDPAWKFESYISSELVAWMDKNYRTVRNRKGRAITGLSMGGHGAMFLSFRHQDVFGAAGSMSGGLGFRPFSCEVGYCQAPRALRPIRRSVDRIHRYNSA